MELGGGIELHAAVREESRTSLPSVSAARRKSGGAKDLFVVFSQGRRRPRNPLRASKCVLPRTLPGGRSISSKAWESPLNTEAARFAILPNGKGVG